MRAVNDAVRIGRSVAKVTVWILATTWIGGRALWRACVLAVHAKELFSQTTRCARNHRVPLYGVYTCGGCRAVSEGYVFRPCRVCGLRPSWTSCPRCGLSVRNPVR